MLWCQVLGEKAMELADKAQEQMAAHPREKQEKHKVNLSAEAQTHAVEDVTSARPAMEALDERHEEVGVGKAKQDKPLKEGEPRLVTLEEEMAKTASRPGV